MRFAHAAKTVSAPKLRAAVITTVALVALAILLFGISPPVTQLSIDGQNFTLEVADNNKTREQGLGGRSSLASNGGMLFSYKSQAIRCIWMRDMRFPLDIVWTDATKKVVQLEERVSPATYPRQFCAQAQYVIELNAGTVRATQVRVGQTLRF